MSIEFARSYKTSDGMCFATLLQAKQHQLHNLFSTVMGLETANINGVVEKILDNEKEIVDLLTTTESSRPKARAVNGGRKPRKNRVTEPVQTTSA